MRAMSATSRAFCRCQRRRTPLHHQSPVAASPSSTPACRRTTPRPLWRARLRRASVARASSAVVSPNGPDSIADITEAKDIMDVTSKHMSDWVSTIVKWFLPGIGVFELTVATHAVNIVMALAVFKLLGYIAHRLHGWVVGNEKAERFDNATRATAAALLKPLRQVFPVVGILLALQRSCTGLDMVRQALEQAGGPAWARALLLSAVRRTHPLEAILADVLGVVVLVSLTWTVLLLKGRWFNSFLARLNRNADSSQDDEENSDLRRVLLPANQLATWAIVALGGYCSLRLLGLDPSPILAVGSVSGVVVGFAAQQLLVNLIAGVSIFVMRSFVVGDVAEVINTISGAVLARGTVAHISPLRTTLLDDDHRTLTVPNKCLVDSIVLNYLRKSTFDHADTVPNTTADLDLKHYLTFEFALARPTDDAMQPYTDHAQRVIDTILSHLRKQAEMVDKSLVAFVDNINDAGCLVIKVNAVAVASTERESPESVKQVFLLAIHEALCSAGAQLAT